MRPIPKKLREQLAADPFMLLCIHANSDCHGAITWEHAFMYAGKQINEAWAIVPCCWYHHLGKGLNKRYNQYVALTRATDTDLAKYPKVDWLRMRQHLEMVFAADTQRAQWSSLQAFIEGSPELPLWESIRRWSGYKHLYGANNEQYKKLA